MKPRSDAAVRLAAAVLVAAALVPLLGVDPGVVGLLLDADFLLLAGMAGLTMLGADAKVLSSRIARSLPVLWVRVGVSLSRSDPGTLLRLDPARSGYVRHRGAREGS
ncbi:MAG TPA: hypothetical protein VFM08_14820 [Nocardioides sp.]|nr:hypothetical protein [Nocardioides sp.]